MASATLTVKGQVTIPKKIRDLLFLHPGDKIEFTVTKEREAVIKPISKKADELFCKLHKPGRKAVSVEEMNNAVKKRMKDTFR